MSTILLIHGVTNTSRRGSEQIDVPQQPAPRSGGRRVPRHHGPFRFRQDDAPQPHRRARSASEG